MTETLWGSSPPAIDDSNVWGGQHTGGITIVFSVDGNVTGARTWVATGNGGIAGYYNARLYTMDTGDVGGSGTLLASKDFGVSVGNEWLEVLFDTPVPVTAGVAYKIAIGSTDYINRKTNLLNSAPITNGHITALQHGTTYTGLTIVNGTMETGNKNGYPNNSHGYPGAGGIVHYPDVFFEQSAIEVSTSVDVVYNVDTSTEILQKASDFFLFPA